MEALAILGGEAKQVAKAVELVQPQVLLVFWNWQTALAVV